MGHILDQRGPLGYYKHCLSMLLAFWFLTKGFRKKILRQYEIMYPVGGVNFSPWSNNLTKYPNTVYKNIQSQILTMKFKKEHLVGP